MHVLLAARLEERRYVGPTSRTGPGRANVGCGSLPGGAGRDAAMAHGPRRAFGPDGGLDGRPGDASVRNKDLSTPAPPEKKP